MSTLPAVTRAVVAERFGPPDVLKLRESVPLRAPGPGQVLVKLYAAGVNPSDTFIRLGPNGPWAATPHLLPKVPYTPGKDGSGVIEAIGEDVTEFAPGDRCYTTGSITGTFAEYAVCTADTVHQLPSRISFAQGACIGVPCATAHRALFAKCKVSPGDAVFIHGASGAVGLAATALALSQGCFVVGSAGTAAGEEAIVQLGATAVNHRSKDYLEAAAAALPAAKHGLFNAVLEMAAHANLITDLELLGPGGQLAVIGSKPEPVALNPRLLMPKEASVHGVFLPACSAEEKRETHRALYEAMESGGLTPIVGTTFTIADAAKAHLEVSEPSIGGKVGNIVVIVREE
jgi:NADPH2:quinone reductase